MQLFNWGFAEILLMPLLAVLVIAAVIYLVRRKSEHRCPDCHKKVPADGQVCPYCGKPLS